MSLLDRAIKSATGRASRPMSHDKANTLLLLFACVLVLAPQTVNQPPWVTATGMALLLWRSWITFRGNRMPPRRLLLPIAMLAMGGVYFHFKTFFGQEAGVAMLVLLLTFKLLEMHASRDLFVVVFLSFFLMLTNFFNSQTIPTALLTVAAVIAMLSAQLSFQYTGLMPAFGKRLKLGAMIFALAAPLTITLFVLFPRIQGPLWGLPSDARVGRTGLSDTMSPGNISKLAQSNEIAFRIKFTDPVPPQSKLYWRGIVLDRYDGRTWTKQSQRVASDSTERIMRGNPVRYQITQEPTSRPWLFALELPANLPQLAGQTVIRTPDQEMISTRPVNERIRYDVASYTDFTLLQERGGIAMNQWLLLPPGFNPKTLDFADRIRRESADDLTAVRHVLNFFHTEKFSYTLQPPLLAGRDGIDDFLFSTRAGFCEHYAGAFVFLMRAMHIPARVVTGYQGGQINPVDGFMTVRQSDAHAWAEVWIAGSGWTRVDPTAAVAPERIERNSDATVTESMLGGLINLNIGRNSLLAKLGFQWEAINNEWNQWVLNYTPEKQKSLLGSLGFDNIDWQTMTLLALSIGMMIMLTIAIPLLFNRRRIDPLDRLYYTLNKRMASRGYARHAHEGPRSYCARLLAAPTLSQEQRHALKQFLTLYEAARYGTVDQSMRAAILPQLKTLLNQCR